jgi:polyhydroxybutyrate depolymerase
MTSHRTTRRVVHGPGDRSRRTVQGPRAVAAVAVAVLLLAGCTGSDERDEAAPTTSTSTTDTTTAAATTEGAAAGDDCAPARPLAADAAEREGGTLAFGGLDRRYLLHLPPQYDGTRRLPVVFDFHGHGSSATVQLLYSRIAPVADREGFVVVAPEGQGKPPHFTLLGATATEADDVEFTVALLDDLLARLCLDPTRVYATGMSNGGALSSVLACRAADRFAATGAVAALIHLPQCAEGPGPAPFVAMMGTEDPVVPYAGGRVNCCGNPNIPAAPDTVAGFARSAGCDPEPASERIGSDVELRRYQGCDDAGAVEFYVIEGGGHTWPGSPIDLSGRGLGATTSSVDATETVWSFFERHRLVPD